MGIKFCGRGRNVMERNIKLNQLKSGLDTAFVDYTHNSSLAYRPEFISNDYQNGKKVLT